MRLQDIKPGDLVIRMMAGAPMQQPIRQLAILEGSAAESAECAATAAADYIFGQVPSNRVPEAHRGNREWQKRSAGIISSE